MTVTQSPFTFMCWKNLNEFFWCKYPPKASQTQTCLTFSLRWGRKKQTRLNRNTRRNLRQNRHLPRLHTTEMLDTLMPWWDSSRHKSPNTGESERNLTEILPDLQQNFRGSSVQLVKQWAETEEQQCGHAETIVAQREAKPESREPESLPAVPIRAVTRAVIV